MKLIREPLLHFILLGAAIFAAFGFVSRNRTDKPGEIVVTQGSLENIINGFTRTWQRPPSESELRGLVLDYIREEAAYREALSMGLDRDDTIVRRRLRQKLEFLSDDIASRTEPTDAELRTFLEKHSALFQSEPTFSFRQVYLNPQLHGANLAQDEARLLADLQHTGPNADLSSHGDPFLLAQNFQSASLSEVKQTFGDQFAASLSTFSPGSWSGPVISGYGTHIVFVTQRNEGRIPQLADVRAQVRNEWFGARRTEAMDKFYDTLLRHYTVKIASAEGKKVAQLQ
jgi:PPIC-type PPIASE domain